jgi:hypothetical protein
VSFSSRICRARRCPAPLRRLSRFIFYLKTFLLLLTEVLDTKPRKCLYYTLAHSDLQVHSRRLKAGARTPDDECCGSRHHSGLGPHQCCCAGRRIDECGDSNEVIMSSCAAPNKRTGRAHPHTSRANTCRVSLSARATTAGRLRHEILRAFCFECPLSSAII